MKENNQNTNTPVQNSTPIQTPVSPSPLTKPKLKLPILISIIIFSIIVGAGSVAYLFLNSSNKEKACTTEAMICPDGTSVGRGGPNCEFSACPTNSNPSPTSDPTVSWKTYTNVAKKYSVKYPSGFFVLGHDWEVAKANNPWVTILKGSPSNLEAIKNEHENREKLYYDSLSVLTRPEKCSAINTSIYRGQEIEKSEVVVDGIIGTKRTSTISTFADPFFGDIIISLEKGSQCYKIYFLRGPNKNSSEELLDQILSTFKFTDSNPTPTCMERPACLEATPRCMIPEPANGWCP